MGIINRFRNVFKNLSTEDVAKDIDDPILRALFLGEEITREKAMSIPSVSSNVDLISSMIASIPIKLYRDKGKKVEEIKKDYRLSLLNEDTKDTLDAFQWKKAIIEDYMMSKGGFSFVKWTKNTITGLYYVESKNVTPYKNADPIFKQCNYMINAKTYRNYEIFRILRNTKDGVTGTSLTSEISKAFETAYATMLYQLNLVKKGGNKKGFLTTQKKLSPEAVERLKQAWKNMYLTNEENCVVLNEGMEFKESSNSSVEMQLDQSKNTLDKQIDKVFHIGTSFDDTFKQAIMPILKAFTSSMNKYLLLENEKKQGYFFDFDTREITRASLKERYEAHKIALDGGWVNKNEIRYEENLDKVDGLDAYSVSLGAVLFDPKTQTYFVPNTGQVKEEGKNDTKKDENTDNFSKNDEKIEKNEPKGEENTEKDEEKKKGGEENEV